MRVRSLDQACIYNLTEPREPIAAVLALTMVPACADTDRHFLAEASRAAPRRRGPPRRSLSLPGVSCTLPWLTSG